MKIICDSKEKKNQHVLDYFERHNIRYEIKGLETGDYMIPGGSVTVDRKKNLDEVWRNLFHKEDKYRFRRELKRAKRDNLTFILLIEHGRMKSVKDIAKWRSKYTSYANGKKIVEELYKLSKVWNIRIEFCDKRSTGRLIYKFLTEGMNNDKRRNKRKSDNT